MQATLIESLPEAIDIVKEMTNQGLEPGGVYRALPRRATGVRPDT